MTIAAHQPNYLPNLAFFSKMASCDLFVIVTNLQFEKHEGWQQRHKIPGPSSDIWLTVPVLGSQNQLIHEVRINNQVNWSRKHKKTLELVYAKSSDKELLEPILAVYEKRWERLVDLNVALILALANILAIKTPVEVDEATSGAKHELLVNVCKKYGADTYLSGMGAKDYLTGEKLSQIKKMGINHRFVENDLTATYPYSTVHYLFKMGRDWVLDVI